MRRPLLLILASLFILIIPFLAHAETKILTAEAAYTMGDGETPSFAEAMVLQKAKQMALEEAGTYVESYTRVQNLDLTTDEIRTLAGGVLQVEVLEKSRTLMGDGVRFYIKIKSTVTTDRMEELAQRIKGRNVADEYKDLQVKYEALTKEIGQLKQTIAKSPPSSERESALDGIRNREQSFSELQRDETALFNRLVHGESLVAEAKKVLRLSDTIVRSMVGTGLTIEVGDMKPTALRYQPGKIELNFGVSVRISDDLYTVLRKTVREKTGTEERISLYPSDLFYGTFYKNIGEDGKRKEKALLMASLFRFPDTKEMREELWYLRDSLKRVKLTVEFLGEKNVLAVCGLSYLGQRLLYPGVELGDKDQEISSMWVRLAITDEVTSTSQYFTSELEYQEFRRLDELEMSHVKSAFKKWEQEGAKEGGLREGDLPKEIQDAIKKKNNLYAPARERWLSNHPPLLRIKEKDLVKEFEREGTIVSPFLLVVDDLYTDSPIKFIMNESTLKQVRQTTARLISEEPGAFLSKSALDDVMRPCKEIVSGSGKTFHVVKLGETLLRISRRYGVNTDQLKKWNNMPDDIVEVGQKLIVEVE